MSKKRPPDGVDEVAPEALDESQIWIDKVDHAKQGMARKGDMTGARAAPGRPHIGHVEGSGEVL